jgi:putative transposase
LASKFRRRIFNDGIIAYIKETLKALAEYHPEVEVLEMNHDEDHIHLLLSIPPKMSVGSVVRIIKSNTAKDMKKKFAFLKKVYWGTGSIWSGGYFVSTVGINEQIIRRYIELQGQEDAGQAKLEI